MMTGTTPRLQLPLIVIEADSLIAKDDKAGFSTLQMPFDRFFSADLFFVNAQYMVNRPLDKSDSFNPNRYPMIFDMMLCQLCFESPK